LGTAGRWFESSCPDQKINNLGRFSDDQSSQKVELRRSWEGERISGWGYEVAKKPVQNRSSKGSKDKHSDPPPELAVYAEHMGTGAFRSAVMRPRVGAFTHPDDDFLDTDNSSERQSALRSFRLSIDALQVALAQLQDIRSQNIVPEHGVVGHNGPPGDEPLSIFEIEEIQNFVDTAKGQFEILVPAPSLIEAGERVSKLGQKAREYADSFAKEAVKSAGKEFGKRLAQVPFWMALASAITAATEALGHWLAIAH
jgi:hypothetical protein